MIERVPLRARVQSAWRQSSLRVWQIGTGLVASGAVYVLRNSIQPRLLPGELWAWLSLLAGVCLLQCSWLLTLLHRHWLRRGFGLLWDADLHPYCPACHAPLVNISRRVFPGTLLTREAGECASCGRLMTPSMEHLAPGIVRDLRNARLILQGHPPETIKDRAQSK